MFLKFFALKKLKKAPLKVAQNFLNPLSFPLLPAQPKWPKQKKSCSKMWPIDQLYIELGPHHISPSFTNYLIFRDIFDTVSSTKLLICNHFSWIVVSRRCNGLFQTKKMGCWLFNQMYLWYQACSDVDTSKSDMKLPKFSIYF